MKMLLLFSVLSIIACSQAGILPASTTLIRQATSIAHPPAVAYTQQYSPFPVAYNAPIAYSFSPTVYTTQHFAPAHYASSPLFAHRPVLAQQSIFAQYPSLIAQTPVIAAQNPVISAQYPAIGQAPIQGIPAASPVQGGQPVIEPADDSPQFPQNPPPQQPQQPPQSPILGGQTGGSAVDDDTVSIEAAS